MSWLPLTPADLQPYLAAPQLAVLQTALLAPGQPDPLPPILADTVARIRAEIRAHSQHRLSADSTLIPSALREAACALALEAAQARLPTLELTGDQVRRADEARRLLARVASGSLALPRPDVPEATPSGPTGQLERVTHRPDPLTSTRLRSL